MAVFYTVNEAAKIIGRSPTSVRRLLRPIVKDDQHPDRQHIQPGIAEVRELRIRGEGFAWRISEELLSREVSARKSATEAEAPPSMKAGDQRPFQELVSMLHEQLQHSQAQLSVKDQQLAVKDQQIASLSEITRSLNERLHEGNVLLATLQRQLSIPEASLISKPVSKVSANKPAPPPARAAPKKTEPKPVTLVAKKQPKRGFFARLFR